MNTNRSTICVHEHAAERNANVCLNCKGQWERKIMNKENKLVIRILKRILLLAVVMFLLSVVVFWLATGTGRSPAVLLRRFPGNDDQR